MVQTVGGTRKSVHLLDFCSLASKADLVLSGQRKRDFTEFTVILQSLCPPTAPFPLPVCLYIHLSCKAKFCNTVLTS